jgi:hypothetical protein
MPALSMFESWGNFQRTQNLEIIIIAQVTLITNFGLPATQAIVKKHEPFHNLLLYVDLQGK